MKPFGICLRNAFSVIAALACFASTGVAAQDGWTEFDHAKLFLLDVTSGPATYVAAFVAGEDGKVTGEMASVRRVRVSPIETRVATVKSKRVLPTETHLEKAIIMNDSEQPIIVYLQTAEELLELTVRAGEGVVIGEMPRHGTTIFGEGCRCICELGDGLHREALITCESIVADLPPQSRCECDLVNGDDCMAYDKRGELSDGRIKASRKIWYPREIETSNENGNGD